MDSCTDLGSVFEFVTAFYIVFFVFFYEVRNHSPALVSEVALKWVTSSFNHQKDLFGISKKQQQYNRVNSVGLVVFLD